MKFSEIIQSNKLVLVDFFATWCGPCKAVAPELEKLKSIQKDNLKIIKIDVDKNPGISAKFQVRGVPTLILFQSGNLVWRESGVLSADQLNQKIKPYA